MSAPKEVKRSRLLVTTIGQVKTGGGGTDLTEGTPLEGLVHCLMKPDFQRGLIPLKHQASSVWWINNGRSIFQMYIHATEMDKWKTLFNS